MKIIDFPIRINESGSMETTGDYQRVVRAQIVDTLMTNFGERIMRPDYGADLIGALFGSIDKLRRDDLAGVIKDRLAYAVPRALIDTVTLGDDPGGEESVLIVNVVYRISSYSDPDTLSIPVVRGGYNNG